MSKRYSGKSFKDASLMKKAKLSFKEKRKKKEQIMLILVWFVICIIFYFVQLLLGNSGHALEVFAVLSAIAIFLISKIRYRIK